MISIESADTSKRGDSLSSSLVMLAKGAAGDCGVDDAAAEALVVLEQWRRTPPPFGKFRYTFVDLKSLRHVSPRLVIIEESCLLNETAE